MNGNNGSHLYPTAFIVTAAALSGASISQVLFVIQYIALGNQGPSEVYFKAVCWSWVASALCVAGFGLWGSYRAIRDRTIRNLFLTIWAFAFFGVFKLDGIQFAWSAIGYYLFIKVDWHQFGIGLNVLGFLLWPWLYAIREKERKAAAAPIN